MDGKLPAYSAACHAEGEAGNYGPHSTSVHRLLSIYLKPPAVSKLEIHDSWLRTGVRRLRFAVFEWARVQIVLLVCKAAELNMHKARQEYQVTMFYVIYACRPDLPQVHSKR